MNLRSYNPYWLLRHGIVNTYPSLNENITTDIAIIGGGISGALIAWELSTLGYRIALFDRRHIGTGSTAASTSLLQYEIDKPLHELIKLVGEKNAVKSYHLCQMAITDVKRICEKLKDDKLFRAKPSFQYASYRSHLDDLDKEFKLRKKNGFKVNWLDEDNIRQKYGFSKPGGILSAEGAEANAYLITHRLLERCISRGVEVYDNTEIISINHFKRHNELLTGSGKLIKTRKLIIACGYESQRYLKQTVQSLQSTYAIISEPFSSDKFWFRNSMIWETAEPYLYLRTTDDNRIIIGGKDDEFSDPNKRNARLASKSRSLKKSFQDLFPSIEFKIDFSWAGTFASTKDGLPYIGNVAEHPNTYFALGFGGNGITFSVIAAKAIRNILSGKKDESHHIFSFNR